MRRLTPRTTKTVRCPQIRTIPRTPRCAKRIACWEHTERRVGCYRRLCDVACLGCWLARIWTVPAMGQERIAQFAKCLGVLPGPVVVLSDSSAHDWLPAVSARGLLRGHDLRPGGIAGLHARFGAKRSPVA